MQAWSLWVCLLSGLFPFRKPTSTFWVDLMRIERPQVRAIVSEEPVGIEHPFWRWPDHPGVNNFLLPGGSTGHTEAVSLLAQLLSPLGLAVARACGRHCLFLEAALVPLHRGGKGTFPLDCK